MQGTPRSAGSRGAPWSRVMTRGLGLVLAALLGSATGAHAELEVHASKRFELQSMSVDGDFSQFLVDNPLFLDGNRFDQNLRLEVTGAIGEKVHVDVLLDDSIFQDEEKRMRLDVTGRVWNLSLGRLPVQLEGSRFLMAPRTGLGMMVTGRTARRSWEAFLQRPEGKTQRNFFQGAGALQEYVLKDSTGAPNPLVVVGSERVLLDGRQLERGVDYEMDYLEGALLLGRSLLPLDERNRLTVEFEEAGQGSGLRSTVYGGRYTQRFGPEKEAWVSLGTVGEFDQVSQLSQQASPLSTGIHPRRTQVLEAAGAVPLARGLLLEGRGAVAMGDDDTSSDEGEREAAGAFDLKLTHKARIVELVAGRSVVEPGFQGVGLDRFQTAGERRFASRDGAVSFLQGSYRPHDDLAVRTSVQEARTNLEGSPVEPEEEVRTGTFEVDTSHVLGGQVDLRYLGEVSRSRAVGEAEPVEGTKDRITALRHRRLGTLGLQLRGEVEDATRAGEVADSYQLAGAELTGPTTSSVQWGLGGTVRAVHRGDPADPTRLERSAQAGASTDLGRDLSLGLDARHRKEIRRDPADTTGPPEQESNTGEARLKFQHGQKLEAESRFTAEVRSRVFLDPVTPYQAGLDSTRARPPPQTALTPNPVLTRGLQNSLRYRPDRHLTLDLGYRWKRESDTVTDDRLAMDESGDGRVSWSPSQAWRASYEQAGGLTRNQAQGSHRLHHSRRLEVVRAFEGGSQVSLGQTSDETDDRASPTVSQFTRATRLGMERRLKPGLTAKGGLSTGFEDKVVRADTTGVDMGLQWTQTRTGSRVELGVVLEDVDREEGQDTSRKRWSLSAAGKLGDEGFLDLGVALATAGEDGRGGGGYQALTTNLSLGVEF